MVSSKRDRASLSDKFSGMLDINLIDASLLLETPLSDNWSVAVAGRRSNIDLVFENVAQRRVRRSRGARVLRLTQAFCMRIPDGH